MRKGVGIFCYLDHSMIRRWRGFFCVYKERGWCLVWGMRCLEREIFFFDRQKKKYIREKKKPIEQKDTGSIQKELDKPDQKDG